MSHLNVTTYDSWSKFSISMQKCSRSHQKKNNTSFLWIFIRINIREHVLIAAACNTIADNVLHDDYGKQTRSRKPDCCACFHRNSLQEKCGFPFFGEKNSDRIQRVFCRFVLLHNLHNCLLNWQPKKTLNVYWL